MQRHKYEYKVDPLSETAAAKVVRMVGSDKKVLEIGAGPGSITCLLKEQGHCHVTAIELDSEAIEKLAPFCEHVYQCDLNNSAWASTVSEHGKFQVVIAADVLEHLYNPWDTLQAMSTLLTEDGYIVVSLPHVGHHAVVSCLIGEDFAYQDWGLLDKTHIRFFGIKNMQQLFNQARLKIVEAQFVVISPEHTEFGNHWQRLPSALKRGLMHNRYGMVYQVVLKAVPESAPGQGLDLTKLPVPSPGPAIPKNASIRVKTKMALKLLARRFLSQSVRTRLSNLLISMGIRL